MKPARFEYFAPTSRSEALAALTEYGDEAKILAGGQSLVPLLNFRLAQPARLIDINRLSDLSYIRNDSESLVIGALTREAEIESSSVVLKEAPLLASATTFIGHPPIRVRGTIGGSLAHNDPAGEYPTALLAMDAEVLVENDQRARVIKLDDLLQEWFSTSLGADEMIREVRIPHQPKRTGTAFEEVAQRRGDFALAGVGVVVTLRDGSSTIEAARIAVIGGPRASRAREAEAMLRGVLSDETTLRQAARRAGGDVAAISDIRGDAAYRKHIIEVLTYRALVRAVRVAQENEG